MEQNGDTALSGSVWKGYTDVALFLLQKGAAFDRQDKFGDTVCTSLRFDALECCVEVNRAQL